MRRRKRFNALSLYRFNVLTFSACISAAPAAFDRYLAIRQLPDRSSHSLHSVFPFDSSPDRLDLMQITKMVGSHCDDTHTAFRTEPPLTQEVLDCAVTSFFPAGLGDMFSTRDGLLMVARVGIPNNVVRDYARYLTSAEMKVRKQQASGGNKRQVGLQDRANESGLPLE